MNRIVLVGILCLTWMGALPTAWAIPLNATLQIDSGKTLNWVLTEKFQSTQEFYTLTPSGVVNMTIDIDLITGTISSATLNSGSLLIAGFEENGINPARFVPIFQPGYFLTLDNVAGTFASATAAVANGSFSATGFNATMTSGSVRSGDNFIDETKSLVNQVFAGSGSATLTTTPLGNNAFEVQLNLPVTWQMNLLNDNEVVGALNDTLHLVTTIGLPTTTAQLESPSANSIESGVGLIRGWACAATEVSVQIDDFPLIRTAYGTDRADTRTACGDIDNGFGLTFNWGLLGDGTHTIRAFADGIEFTSANFTVATLGSSFLTGINTQFTVTDFPTAGINSVISWAQTSQNFIFGVANNSTTATGSATQQLESPAQGSVESGIGLIRGWSCTDSTITVAIDNFPALPAGGGTARNDTLGVCGDANNGFGLTFNWGLLGDGPHTLRALADGVEFAQVTFTVTTLGVPFLTGASAEATIPDFPATGQQTQVRWSEAHQNFIVVGKQ